MYHRARAQPISLVLPTLISLNKKSLRLNVRLFLGFPLIGSSLKCSYEKIVGIGNPISKNVSATKYYSKFDEITNGQTFQHS